jgi:predicted ATPase/class 3 adenylate cyclase/tRNA A-37 threonylcarbamoyl transferase component Bud32
VLSFSNYNIKKEIFSNDTVCIYRGFKLDDKTGVILKILKSDFNPQDISRLKHEYNLLHDLNLKGVIHAYGLEKQGGRYALILEDMQDAISLTEFIKTRKLTIEGFLLLAIHLARALSELHLAGIIHKDINPNNVIVAQSSSEIKLIDLSMATRLEQEISEIKNIEMLEGTLAYISPEQTGRMNKAIDHRTDLYSLGITFYEMLTGQLPFEANDPIEWVHAHIAKLPIPPNKLRRDIPEVISEIIMKLLAKSAENRYITANGLVNDLQRCLDAWHSVQKIEKFTLGENDYANTFYISQELYGRKEELDSLMSSFDRIARGGKELVLITGYSGIGKSSLVNEIYKPVMSKHGYFIPGKFEKLKNNIPYLALIEPFRQLILHILSENKETMHRIRRNILDAIGANGQVIIEMIPEVEHLIGKQPPVPELPAAQSRNRFELTMFDFINALAQKDHPLVIFLDDLQWADSASLRLIEQILLDRNLKYLLLIGCYRENEVSMGHPVLHLIEAVEKNQIPLNHLTLKPLSLIHIEQLLKDSLQDIPDIKPLAQIIFKKTAGNPFFVNTFLRTIYKQHFIFYDKNSQSWQFHLENIEKFSITDNVVDLIVDRIKLLADNTQKILKIAACIGNQFDLQTLSLVSNKSPTEIANALWPLVQENLLIPLNVNFQYVMEDENFIINNKIIYKFSHDRIQHAAYSLLADEERPSVELKIARVLLKNIDENELKPQQLFELVRHFNACLSLLTDKAEKLKVALLNQQAARNARRSIAYGESIAFIESALKLLEENPWEHQYDLAFNLNKNLAESLFLSGNTEQAEVCFASLISHAKNVLHKAEIYRTKTSLYSIDKKYSQAIQSALTGLKLFGISIPENCSVVKVLWAISGVLWKTRFKNVADLELPRMENQEKIMIIRLYVEMMQPTYIVNQLLFAFITAKMVKLTLDYGYTDSSAHACMAFSYTLIGILNLYKKGFEFVELGNKIIKKSKDILIIERARSIFWWLNIWKYPLKEIDEIVLKNYHITLEQGDTIFALDNMTVYLLIIFADGKPLHKVIHELKSTLSFLDKVHVFEFYALFDYMAKFLEYIQEDEPSIDNILSMDDLKLKDSSPSELGFLFAAFCKIYYIMGDYPNALRAATNANKYLNNIRGLFAEFELKAYHALALAASFPSMDKRTQKKSRKQILKFKDEFKIYAKRCPANFMPYYLLISAELAGITKDYLSAANFYEQAINVAEEYDLEHLIAISNERAMRYYLSLNHSRTAMGYLRESLLAYYSWGAQRKVSLLQAEFPSIALQKSALSAEKSQHISIRKISSVANKYSSSASSSGSKYSLDLISVMKSVQTISSLVRYDELLDTFIHLAIENAGAERGMVLLLRNDELHIVAAQENQNLGSKINLESHALSEEDKISLGILQYVKITKHTVVLDDAANEGSFIKDAYIIKAKPLSVLCMPIISQGKLLGILYLENNLVTGAFTTQRCEVLSILSSQAAISLENALLYSAYDQFVPHQFIELLGKRSVIDIRLGDSTSMDMAVMFTDIRNFTQLSETMTAKEIFSFMNEYLGHMEPIIQKNGGFIDKYIGDSIMVLFPSDPVAAVQTGIEMQKLLTTYNQELVDRGLLPIKIGVGVSDGNLILGTLGTKHRLETTVLSEVVNIASRIENLTKKYGSQILITETLYNKLPNEIQVGGRCLGKTQLRGINTEISLWEIFIAEEAQEKAAKMAIANHYNQAVQLLNLGEYEKALHLFQRCLHQIPEDRLIKAQISKCLSHVKHHKNTF